MPSPKALHKTSYISWRSSRQDGERGVVIVLVAVVLLFVVGAIAVLAIDLASLYTARSEAQLAADAGALAGARALANSGVTSNPSDTILANNASDLAIAVATRVAASNRVGGRTLADSEVNVTVIGDSVSLTGLGRNPRVKVQVKRTDLPTFFARIWGQTQLQLSATAEAEAYNPSGLNAVPGNAPPVAPICVKPWVLPNINPVDNTSQIFAPDTGTIQNVSSLLGWTDNTGRFRSICSNCNAAPIHDPAWRPAAAWRFYPGDASSFPVPTQSLPACVGIALNGYQNSVAGCVSVPIACHSTVNLDHSITPGLFGQTSDAVNCLTHSASPTLDGGDQVVVTPGAPFQFLAGDGNPVVGVRGNNVLVSDSLVTVPVYDGSTGSVPGSTPPIVIGFVQLFLNPDGHHAPPPPPPPFPPPPPVFPGINTTIVNLVGCGTNATTTPIIGNGASPVAVRLVTPQ